MPTRLLKKDELKFSISLTTSKATVKTKIN